MNCMNQSRGLQDVAARPSINTIDLHPPTHQPHEAGHDTMQTANAPELEACNTSIERLSTCTRSSKAAPQYGQDSFRVEGSCVLVTVNAAKISRHALEWALTNIVQPGDHIILLALLPGRRLWRLALISGDCARRTVVRKGAKMNGKPVQDVKEEISEGCFSMMQELRSLCDSKKAKVSIKIVAEGERGAIAMEADRTGASWVVLDKHVMKEGKVCLEHLKCNVVMVKQSKSSKVLRLNLKGPAVSARHDIDPRLASTPHDIINTQTTSLTKNTGVFDKLDKLEDCIEHYKGQQPELYLNRAPAENFKSSRELRATPARLSSSSSIKRTTKNRFSILDAETMDFYNDGAASSESCTNSDADNFATPDDGAACAHILFSSDGELSGIAANLQLICVWI